MVTPVTPVSVLADRKKVPGFPGSKTGDLQTKHGPHASPGYRGGQGKCGDWDS